MKPLREATTMATRSTPRRLHLERSLLYHFAVVSSRVGGTVHALCRERYGMSAQGWRVVAHLGELQPVSAKEIGRRAAMDSVSLSRALAQLDALGFVERTIDESDRRRIILRLTPSGQAVYDTVAPYTAAAEVELLRGLSASERSVLRQLTRRIWETSVKFTEQADPDS
jgi:DNA-binding MarR family transcriptional regulator